jgi:hypothetical protein
VSECAVSRARRREGQHVVARADFALGDNGVGAELLTGQVDLRPRVKSVPVVRNLAHFRAQELSAEMVLNDEGSHGALTPGRVLRAPSLRICGCLWPPSSTNRVQDVARETGRSSRWCHRHRGQCKRAYGRGDQDLRAYCTICKLSQITATYGSITLYPRSSSWPETGHTKTGRWEHCSRAASQSRRLFG